MRTKNSTYNMIATMASYLVALLFNFITQAIFIKTLGIEYLGVNGLFTNILTMLAVAELGIGSTIVYKLYKPLAEKDYEKIKSWMNFYKKCYNWITIIILLIGLTLIPFLEKIVGTITMKENITILYVIQLIDIALSYCMSYKRSLLYANEKNFIINMVHIAYIIFMNITQIFILFFTKNYILYLISKLIYRMLENILINKIVDKFYPFIKEKAKPIDEKERKDIINRVKAIFLQKISFVINKGIDNIIISSILGVVVVGYYTNYYTIVSTVSTIIYQIISSLTASVGNLLTENNKEKNYQIYKKINMLNSFITGICIVLFMCLITPFIKLWIGEKYLLSLGVLISFAIYLYTDSIRRAITLFKDAAGICTEDKYMYLIMIIINLSLSILLCKELKITGVILATAISYMFLILISYPKYIYEPVFNKKKKEYYKENIKYLVFIIFSAVFSFTICINIEINSNLLSCIINGIISSSIYLILFILMFKNTKEYKYYLESISKIIKKRKH